MPISITGNSKWLKGSLTFLNIAVPVDGQVWRFFVRGEIILHSTLSNRPHRVKNQGQCLCLFSISASAEGDLLLSYLEIHCKIGFRLYRRRCTQLHKVYSFLSITMGCVIWRQCYNSIFFISVNTVEQETKICSCSLCH